MLYNRIYDIILKVLTNFFMNKKMRFKTSRGKIEPSNNNYFPYYFQ